MSQTSSEPGAPAHRKNLVFIYFHKKQPEKDTWIQNQTEKEEGLADKQAVEKVIT